LPEKFVTTDIRGQLVFLGTGTSVGVPVIGCGCDVCQTKLPKNQRTRSSVVLGLPEGNLLIDTTPDLRFQLLREGLGIVHSVLYTHEHADHLFGLDDLRLFPFFLKHAVPLYCEKRVEARIRTSFDYAFRKEPFTHAGAAPRLQMHRIDLTPFQALGQPIIPLRLKHGPNFDVLGFRFGAVAYCTDVNEIPAESWNLLQGLDTLILGALRDRPHPTHFSLEEAIGVAEKLKPRRTYLTHTSHELDYEATNARLPSGIELAYDGLKIRL
jgi:phosphoribosyl 1,2-cyclic phosphate phosphodiesterase